MSAHADNCHLRRGLDVHSRSWLCPALQLHGANSPPIAGVGYARGVSAPFFHVSLNRKPPGERWRCSVTLLAEPEVLIRSAVALARRSAWHAKQSADLANEAEELLADAAKLQHERGSPAAAPRLEAYSKVAVPHPQTDAGATPRPQRRLPPLRLLRMARTALRPN